MIIPTYYKTDGTAYTEEECADIATYECGRFELMTFDDVGEVPVFIPLEEPTYTRAHLDAERDILKQRLLDTDYIVIKIAEGVATADEYASEIAERQEARARINEIEDELENF